MAPKIFITGATGYIAGDALYVLNKAHPEYEYTALVRSQEKADKVRAAYPKINIVLGGLDDSSLLEEEAAKADVVLRRFQDILNIDSVSLTHLYRRCRRLRPRGRRKGHR